MLRVIKNTTIDHLGFTLSFLCGIHCIAFPLILVFTPIVSDSVFYSETFEWIIIISSLLIASYALIQGFIIHQNKQPLLLLAASLVLICLSKFIFLDMETIFMPIVGFLLSFGHLRNHKLLKFQHSH